MDEGIVEKFPGLGTKIVTDKEHKRAEPPSHEGSFAKGNILLIAQENYFTRDKNEDFHLNLFKRFEKIITSYGYNMILRSMSEDFNLAETIASAQPVGIIVDSYNKEEVYENIAALKIPAVSINHYTPLITSVVSDNTDGAYTLTKMLLDAGHKKIAIIKGKRSYQTTVERMLGVQSACLEAGIKLDEEFVFPGDWLFQTGYSVCEKIFALDETARPTALFAFNDEMAYGAMSYCAKNNIKIPETLSIVGFDKSVRYVNILPSVTTQDVNIDSMVQYAFMYLLSRINGADFLCNAKIEIETVLVDCGTIAKPLI